MERVEAGVHDTRLVRATELDSLFNAQHGLIHSGVEIYLKLEGDNATGTHKDRGAVELIGDYLERNGREESFNGIIAATCGNHGAALARAARIAGIPCTIFVPIHSRSAELDYMREQGATIVSEGHDYEASIEASARYAAEHKLYNGNPGGANGDVLHRGFARIMYEIIDDLNRDTDGNSAPLGTVLSVPKAVSIAMSNATTIASFGVANEKLMAEGLIAVPPRLIGGTMHGRNLISFVNNKLEYVPLETDHIEASEVCEELVNRHSLDGTAGFRAIEQSRGAVVPLLERDLNFGTRAIETVGIPSFKREGQIEVIPASSAGFAALWRSHRTLHHLHEAHPESYPDGLPPGRYVVVVTGEVNQPMSSKWHRTVSEAVRPGIAT